MKFKDLFANNELHLKYKLKILILIPHLYLVFGSGSFNWKWFLISYLLFILHMAIQFIGPHRLFAHNSFKTFRPVELFLIWGHVILGQASCMTWVANHRTHHRYADKMGDPHSPHTKAWWKAWLGLGQPIPVSSFVVRDLMKDPVQVFVHTHYFKILFLFALLTYALGGAVAFKYIFCWPMVLTFHANGFINVACHLFGYRLKNTPDHSANNWSVFFLTWGGEGWHNYHHAHPTDHRHGHGKYEFDSYAFIIERFLRKPQLEKET